MQVIGIFQYSSVLPFYWHSKKTCTSHKKINHTIRLDLPKKSTCPPRQQHASGNTLQVGLHRLILHITSQYSGPSFEHQPSNRRIYSGVAMRSLQFTHIYVYHGYPRIGLAATPNHPFVFGIFHEINHPASLGYPHDYGNPHPKTLKPPWWNLAPMDIFAS